MKAQGILESEFCGFLFSVDPCGGVRLDFGRKMKLVGETLYNRGSTQFSALIPNLMRSRVLVLSFTMEKSPTLLKNSIFRYPAPFPALAKREAKLLYRSNVASLMQFFKGYPMNKHPEVCGDFGWSFIPWKW